MDYKRHLPIDTSLMSMHVALNRVWDAIEGGDSARSSEFLRVAKKVQIAIDTTANDIADLRGTLDAINDDDVLTIPEKKILIPIIDGYIAERISLQPKAESLGFVPENPDQYAIWTDYSNALDNLTGFLEAYGKNGAGVWEWRDTTQDLQLGLGNGKLLGQFRTEYQQKYATLLAAMWQVTFEISITAELANSTAVQAAQDAPKVVNGLPALPSSTYPVGKLVYDTVTKRLYRSTGNTWESATVAAGDVIGQLTSDQISNIVASKVSGQLTSDQIASLVASKLSGQITTTQITDNAITTGQIAANAVTADQIYAGSITTTKLAAGAVTADTIAANAITSDKIYANSVTATKIASGAIETDKLAANAITAAKIAANTITANEIASDSITAGLIKAGAVGADEIAGNSVYAKHLVVANFDNLIPNPSSELSSPSGAIDGAGVTASGSAYSGSYIRSTTSSVDITNPIPCSPGDQYIIQAQTRGACRLVIGWYYVDNNPSPNTYHLISSSSNTSSNGSWGLLSAVGTAPSGTTSVKFTLQSTGGTAEFDALYARRMADANMMVDGTITSLFQKVGAYIESAVYSPGGAGYSATGFHLASSPFSVTYRDGSTASDCLFELGGTASVNGFRIGDVTNKAVGGLLEYGSAGSYSFTPNPGVKEVEITLQGGGGNGASGYGGGGGAGQYIRKRVSVTPGTTYTIVVGGATASSTAFGLTAYGGSNGGSTSGGNGTGGLSGGSSAGISGTGTTYAIEDPELGWNIQGSGGGGPNDINADPIISGGGFGGNCGNRIGGGGGGTPTKYGGGGGGASAMANGGTGGTEGAVPNGTSGSLGSGGGGGLVAGSGGVGYARIRW